ncbi:MAG TPA: DoxX family protein [Rhodocyclaceae bacterium]|jgi:putative oxidoreductase|nr:DoxX family protein [Rhodocyclaceae bacterium]
MNNTSHSLRHFAGTVYAFANCCIGFLERWLTPLFQLALRLYVAEVFLRSGILKLSDWSGTLYLFDNVYAVPVLPPHLAAVMGTMGETLLPILLILGLAGRFAAAGVFVTNLMAAISFPDISDLGLQDHKLWGLMLLVLVFFGPGRFSLDQWIKKRCPQRNEAGSFLH